MIQVKELSVRYAASEEIALSIDHLTIHEGECMVVCGKSGSGKSTFLRVLNGLVPEYYEADIEGECSINNVSVWDKTVEELSFIVGTVFQNPATQFFHQKVEAELVFPCENQGLSYETIRERLDWVTELLDLKAYLEKDLLELSGGERQKIAMATALMQQPRLLLLDEPTANLDADGVCQIQEAIQKIKESGITILISEHRLHFLRELADRYLYFDQGNLTQEWSVASFSQLSTTQRKSLGLRSRRKKTLPMTDAINDKEGLEIGPLDIRHSQFNLSFPKIIFPTGSVTGVIGKNGVGKTTLLTMIAGLTFQKNAEVKWCGQTLSSRERIEKTAFVMQDVRLQFVTPSVAEEIALGGAHLSKEVCRQLALETVLMRHPLSLSGGQQQRVMIANAIALKKQIYLFDEPTSGLDYQQMLEVSRLLKGLRSEHHVVIVVSHDDEFLAECCDSIIKLESPLQ